MGESDYPSPVQGYNVGISRNYITDEDAWTGLLNRCAASYNHQSKEITHPIIGQMLREAEYITGKPCMYTLVEEE